MAHRVQEIKALEGSFFEDVTKTAKEVEKNVRAKTLSAQFRALF